MSDNPYAAPKVDPENPFSSSSQDSIRRMHLRHETSIKSIGILYYLAFGLLLFGCFISSDEEKNLIIVIPLSLLFLGLGFGIRRLANWARFGVVILSVIWGVIGLLGIPVASIICAYVLFLLLGQKGRMIFSEEYKEVIADTPHLKYGTSKAAWIVLLIFLLLVGGISAFLILKWG